MAVKCKTQQLEALARHEVLTSILNLVKRSTRDRSKVAVMSELDNWVTPISQRKHFTQPNYTLKDKIRIFEERVDGWQLQIAEEILKRIKAKKPKCMKHAAYALISVVISYFEMIGHCIETGTSDTSCFRAGFKAVFDRTTLTDTQISKIYRKVRCGMYHVAYTNKGVILDGTYKEVFTVLGDRIELNPHRIIPAIRALHEIYF